MKSTAVLSALLLTASTAFAAPPRVSFDVPRTVELHDVTPPEWAAKHPGRKLVEAVLKVSLKLESGAETDLEKVVYELRTSVDAVTVADFLPSSTMGEKYEGGTAEIVVQSSNGGSLVGYVRGDAKIEGQARIPGVASAEADAKGGTGASVQYTTERTSRLTTTVLMPRELLVASGTLDRGTAVYFKLKPTDRTTLQEQRSFSVILDAPAGLRGAVCLLKCSAIGIDRGKIYDAVGANAGAATFEVGTYGVSDTAAKTAVVERLDAARSLVDVKQERTLAAEVAATTRREEVYESERPGPWSYTFFSYGAYREYAAGRDADEAENVRREEILNERLALIAAAEGRLKTAKTVLAELNRTSPPR